MIVDDGVELYRLENRGHGVMDRSGPEASGATLSIGAARERRECVEGLFLAEINRHSYLRVECSRGHITRELQTP